jgi:colanic acid/amylovoran biosynthesis glycosyltransferase
MKKVYFILGGFPVVSQSFIYNQITEVIKNKDLEVRILVLNKKKGKVHPEYDHLNRLVEYLPSGREKGLLSKLTLILKSFLFLAFSNPLLLLRSINFMKYGRDAANGHYLIRAAQFSRLQPDLYHCHFGTTGRLIADLKDMAAVKCRMITSFHGKDITVYPQQFGKNYYSRLFSTADMFTANSRFIMGKMQENGCPASRIVKIPMCLDMGKFAFRAAPPRGNTFKILTVGRLVEKKGYPFSLAAAALLKAAGVNFVYNIIGDGPLMDDMVKRSRELGIADRVVFHGAMMQDRVKEFYRDSHVFMLPSVTAPNGDTEGQGLVLQEAQAIGLPVLATLHNGFPDSIMDGRTGFLVPEKDAPALFEKLRQLADDEHLCHTMGRLGRQFVEKNFDAQQTGKQLIGLYDQLIGRSTD